MAASIEQSNRFHIARRIAKFLAPEYRIFTTDALEPNQIALDVRNLTIEIGEGTPEMEAIAGLLFQVGHLKLRNSPLFQEHFGKLGQLHEKRAISKLISQGIQADTFAQEWAVEALKRFYDLPASYANELVSRYVWTQTDWENYYNQ